MVARSNAEAELRAMTTKICEGVWLKRMLEKLKIYYNSGVRIMCDNKVAINMANLKWMWQDI